jgi:hypothetical protein
MKAGHDVSSRVRQERRRSEAIVEVRLDPVRNLKGNVPPRIICSTTYQFILQTVLPAQSSHLRSFASFRDSGQFFRYNCTFYESVLRSIENCDSSGLA